MEEESLDAGGAKREDSDWAVDLCDFYRQACDFLSSFVVWAVLRAVPSVKLMNCLVRTL